MNIYELRVDGGDCYYSLGLFESLESLFAAVSSHDGKDGGPVHDFGGDGETLEVWERQTDTVNGDCATPGVLVAVINRDWQVDDDDNLVWLSERQDEPKGTS